MLRQRFTEARKELEVQVRRRHMRAVSEVVAAGEETPVLARDLMRQLPAERHASVANFPSLLLDLLALVVSERGKEIVEAPEITVAPVELHRAAQHHPAALELARLGFRREEDVEGRDFAREAER